MIDRLTGVCSVTSFPIANDIAGTLEMITEICLVFAGKISFICRKAKEFEPFEEVLAPGYSFRAPTVALQSSIYHVGGRAECCSNVCSSVDRIGHEEACHDVMHAGLGVLRRHVEPNT